MQFEHAIIIARHLGFQYLADVRHRPSMRKAFPKEAFTGMSEKGTPITPRLTGIYLQFRTDGRLYIGQTVDLIRREQQHLDAGVRVDFLAFLPTPQSQLTLVERRLIHKAHDLKVPLGNVLERGFTQASFGGTPAKPKNKDQSTSTNSKEDTPSASLIEDANSSSLSDDPDSSIDPSSTSSSDATHASSTSTHTDAKANTPDTLYFDEIFDEEIQKDFLSHLIEYTDNFTTITTLYKTASPADTRRWQQFVTLLDYWEPIKAATRFVERFIPRPEDSLGSFVGVKVRNFQRNRECLTISTSGDDRLFTVYGWGRAPGHYRVRLKMSAMGIRERPELLDKMKQRLAWATFTVEGDGLQDLMKDAVALPKRAPRTDPFLLIPETKVSPAIDIDCPLTGFPGLLLDRECCQWVGVWVLSRLQGLEATDRAIGNRFAEHEVLKRLRML